MQEASRRKANFRVFGEISFPTAQQENASKAELGFRRRCESALAQHCHRDSQCEQAVTLAMKLYREHRDMGGDAECPLPLPARRRQELWVGRGRRRNQDPRRRRRVEGLLIAAELFERDGARGLRPKFCGSLGPAFAGRKDPQILQLKCAPSPGVPKIRHFPKILTCRKTLWGATDPAPGPTDADLLGAAPTPGVSGPPGDPGPSDEMLLSGQPDEADAVGLGLGEKEKKDQVAARPLNPLRAGFLGPFATEAPMEKPATPAPNAGLTIPASAPPWLKAMSQRVRARLDEEKAERLARGLPAEEAYVPVERPPEAACRGFSRENAPAPTPAYDPPAETPHKPSSPAPARRAQRCRDDGTLADLAWVQWELRRVPCLAPVSIPTLVAKKYTRGIWRAAVAALLAEAPGRLRETPQAFLLGVAKRLHEGEARDVRFGPHFFPIDTWPPAMFEVAKCQ